MADGRTIALYGDSGSGKTTQAGEYAKHVRKTRGLNTVLVSSDMGGYDSLAPLVRLGVIEPVTLDPGEDPWIWINNGVEGKRLDGSLFPESTGCVVFDSGTSDSEALLSAITKSDFKIGTQNTQKFTVTRGTQALQVGANNEAHYGIVQSFMLDSIWRSTWLTKRGIDVIWTFSVHRGERADDTPILGPKLAGKALTAAIPKWFNYTFRIVSIPVLGEPARHVLYLQEQPEMGALATSFGNARYPLDAQTTLPATIEPASVVKAVELIEAGQQEAENALREELGL